ncbi:alpha-glucan family phosphorylase [Candidatus Poribacteria bacterium]
MTKPIRTFTVVPTLPPRLQNLRDIAYNLFWAWNYESIDLFRRLGRELWEETGHNPVHMLGSITQSELERLAEDDAFLGHMDRVHGDLQEYMQVSEPCWYEGEYGKRSEPCIAYFSAEYGITDCMPMYSGGLGVLAGDHLKSASDLGVPLVGVGLLYQQGYFSQYLNADGWQQELYPENDFYNMAIELEQHEDGTPVTVSVDYPTGTAKAQIWRVQVGRVALFLLDTNIPDNPRPEHRDITDQLYVADREMRLRQEILLGIGGVRALAALGINPAVYHMNEGHSAFLALERICRLKDEHVLSFDEAKELVTATSVFTIHTPVPAGNEEFSVELIEKYLSDYCVCMGVSLDELLAMGRQDPKNTYESFSMAVLALRLASHINGVSRLHGAVSRKIWGSVWPDVPEDEVPISSIVNGIHIKSWVSKDMQQLFDRYLGPEWSQEPSNGGIWERVYQIPDDELWRTHERRRERLVAFVRGRLQKQLENRGALSSEIDSASESLNPEALTIGFARRFAGYKRSTLLLRDAERLAGILGDKDRPVQIIYAGKAHPRDTEGKEMIQAVIHACRREEFRRNIVFIEDHDMSITRYLVQGVDLWLNTPRRLREASGTSGMKAAANGVINMSVLDGWWHEVYNSDIGWAIGREEDYDNADYQDMVESNAIYEMLEKEVVPMFYNRGTDHLPRGWIARMKTSMSAICPKFNTHRMIHEYIKQAYHPCIAQWGSLTADDFAKVRELTSWKSCVRQNWSDVRIDKVEMDEVSEVKVGEHVTVKAQVHLGNLTPEDVAVEVYQGEVDPQGNLINALSVFMNCSESHGEGDHTFVGAIPCRSSGLRGYSVRVLPRHYDLASPHELGLILWAP